MGKRAYVGYEHAEGGTPVADVIEAEDVVAEGFECSGEAVSDDCGAEVTDVHFFSDVGR